ncbi:AVAST type 1 anti-phage system protein Avs1c [Neptunicella marina]|uniref:Uncharacterized protein n=1 Tax=Neptunicella marina TaxID=2125989 RepID=A0A8J6IU28_9ALTE|nr:AVAST type 1 anti-phage system protein Avs1c [Neptunicella marina]MBC3766696.1 hypothetical protein [Neptunicella marina]
MNFERMDTPETRAEFERRFHYMYHQMKAGKFHVGPDVSMGGVLKVRKLPNGRIDFLSVNEQARLQANTVYNMRNFKDPEHGDNE